MTSKEVKEYVDGNKLPQLIKKCEKYLNLIDEWGNKFIDGDLLNEYELKFAQQQLNGCQTVLNSIAGALESMVVEFENNYYLQEENTYVRAKFRPQDKSHCTAFAREKVSELRSYASDFKRYVDSAQSAVTTTQSLLKRQTIEKSNKGLDYTGEVVNAEQAIKILKKGGMNNGMDYINSTNFDFNKLKRRIKKWEFFQTNKKAISYLHQMWAKNSL